MLLLLINIYKFYVKILWTKKIEVIREQRKKEREETKKRCAADSHSVVNKVAQRLVEKRYRANFKLTWSTLAIKEASNKFHQNFQTSFRAHPLGYKGVNLGISTSA
jgi:hypothetical protein